MNFKKLMLAFSAGLLLFSCAKEGETETVADTKSNQAAVVQKVTNPNDFTKNQQAAELKARTQELTTMKFEETSHDFGTIQQGDKVKHTFKFTNTGDKPLIISNTKVTCGCTTPNYTRSPIAPNEQGEIEVQFNSAGKRGIQNKTITVLANVEGGSEKIMIKTNVEVPDNSVGPVKSSSK